MQAMECIIFWATNAVRFYMSVMKTMTTNAVKNLGLFCLLSLVKLSVRSLTGDTRLRKGYNVQFKQITVISLALLEISLANKHLQIFIVNNFNNKQIKDVS